MAVPKILYTPVWDRILYMNAIKSKSIALTDNHPEPCTSPLRLEPLQNKISPIKTVELIWDSRHLCMICFGLPLQKAVIKTRKTAARGIRISNSLKLTSKIRSFLAFPGCIAAGRVPPCGLGRCDVYPIWLQPQEDVKSDRTYMCWNHLLRRFLITQKCGRKPVW